LFISQKVTKTLPSTTTNSLSGNTNINGTGWLPIDFTSSTLGSSIPSLPIDPKNNSSYYYTFMSGENYFELDCILESKTYRDKMTTDGGSDNGRYEVGTSLAFLPQPNNIVAFWQMDEASWNGTTGEVIDQTSNHIDGTAYGMTTVDNGIIGRCGSSVHNSGNRIDIPTIAAFYDAFDNAWTVSVWVKLTADNDGIEIIFDKPFTSHASPSYHIWIWADNAGTNNRWTATIVNSAGTEYLKAQGSVGSVVLNQWTHLVTTFDLASTILKLYKNGSEIASDTTPSGTYANYDYGASFCRLKNYNGYDPTGLIDEAIIWNVALTSDEVATLYASGAPIR